MIAYFISFLAIIYAIISVDGYVQIYTLLYFLVFPTISVEMERFMRMSFINHMVLKEVFIADQKRMETEQMRSIIGNMVTILININVFNI